MVTFVRWEIGNEIDPVGLADQFACSESGVLRAPPRAAQFSMADWQQNCVGERSTAMLDILRKSEGDVTFVTASVRCLR